MFSVEPRPRTVLHLCDDIACKVAGAEALIEEVERRAGEGLVLRSPCLGMCERARRRSSNRRATERGHRPGIDRAARSVPARRRLDG
jgi:NADH:ubiquinone oxidoreductase subunit E